MRPTKMTWQERQVWEDERKALVAGTLQEVAQILGWKVEAGDSSTYLADAPHKLHVYLDTWHDRLSFSGWFPYAMSRHKIGSGPHADPECKITVNPLKTPKQIARDIELRIFPVYGDLWAVLAKRDAKHNAEQQRQQNLAERIALNGRGEVQLPSHYSSNELYWKPVAYFGAAHTSGGAPWGKAEISDYNGLHATMQLHNIPPELAEYIASLLGEWGKEPSEA